jgi:hypothetical protein
MQMLMRQTQLLPHLHPYVHASEHDLATVAD